MEASDEPNEQGNLELLLPIHVSGGDCDRDEAHRGGSCRNCDDRKVRPYFFRDPGTRLILPRVSCSITDETISANLYTSASPPLDILIRTSGVSRLSDFLLWQARQPLS